MAKDFAKDDSIAKVIDEIGKGKVCFTQGNIDDLRSALLKDGWDSAEAKAAQLAGTDGYTDLLGIIAAMRKHKLSPEAGAEVLKNIFQIRAGHK